MEILNPSPHRETGKQAVVLAGGLGTRLRSVVADIPKVLAPVGQRPFIHWILDSLVDDGFSEICLAIGYLGDAVRAACGSKHLSLRGNAAAIVYSSEDAPLGTGGAIYRALGQLADRPTFVLNGDTFLRPDWNAMLHERSIAGAPLVIAVREVPDVSRFGAVDIRDGRIVAFGEKMLQGRGYINAGVYLLQRSIFAGLRESDSRFSMEQDLIAARLTELRPVAYITNSDFLDIGVPDDYARANDFLAKHLPDFPRTPTGAERI
ncbi:MAG: NTP transferase domain-containing protein [Rhodocyclales bacterium]|nr:NTP transferase domain-containing protein [Rhodocyclales bacterium]